MLPNEVTYAEIAALIDGSKDAPPIIGLADGNQPITVDLDDDSPHVLAASGAGRGKTVLLRTVLSQALAAGGHGVIFDPKIISHPWAEDLAKCEYHRSVETIHDRLLVLREEAARRAGVAGHIDVGPRIWVLIEELGPLVNRLIRYWREIKAPGEPDASPAVEALCKLLGTGAEQRRVQVGAGPIAPIKMHVVASTQRSSAALGMGGLAGWENFGTRCLADYPPHVWRLLRRDVSPLPSRSRHRGRWQVVATDDTVTETQVGFFSPREARTLAECGWSRLALPAPGRCAQVLTWFRERFGRARAGRGGAVSRRLTGGGSR
ncbi:MAG: hypothetical protein L0I76_08440 [Pseudonocardia sp.]|nr:hypothetical protein [Pseudonocardia sp.]